MKKIFLYLLFFIYINVVIYCEVLFNYPTFEVDTMYFFITIPISLLIEFMILKFLPKILNKINICKKNDQTKSKKFMIIFVIITILLAGINYFLYRPGVAISDTMGEYSQAVGNDMLTNWHTIWHVILFYKLPLIIHESYGTVVTFQIILFVLSLSYLIYILYKNNINAKIILTFCIFLWINPYTYIYMLAPYKDSAFSVIMITLTAIFINKYFNKDKYSNVKSIFLISLLLVIGLLIKRNSILSTLPLIITYIVLFDKKNIFIHLVCIVLIYAGFIVVDKKINYWDIYQYNVETTGMFMNMVSYVMKVNPSVMDGEYREMLDEVSTQNYQKYDMEYGFDSMKGEYDTLSLNEYGKMTIIKMGLHALVYDFKDSSLAFFNLIKEVYSISSKRYYYFQNQYVDQKNDFYDVKVKIDKYQHLIPSILYCSYGLILFIFVSLFVVGVINKKKWCLFTLPVILYQFGTSLLLSIYNARYFEHIYYIFIPLFMIILIENYVSNNSERNMK